MEADGPRILVPGDCYIVAEKKPFRAFEMFRQFVEDGVPTLALCRMPPHQVRKIFGSYPPRYHWISRSRTTEGVSAVTNLGMVVHHVSRFLDEALGPGVILLEGLEYLVNNNGFSSVIRVMEDIQDLMATSRSILLLPVYMEAFDPREAAILERGLEVVESADEISFPSKEDWVVADNGDE